MKRILLLASLLIWGATQVLSGDYIDEQRRADARVIRQANCTWYGIQCYRDRYYPPRRTYYAHRPREVILEGPKVYGYTERGDRRAECLSMIRAVGDERQSVEKAKDAAARAWMGNVRFHWGERYIEIDNARHVRFTCSRSSVNDTVLGKLQENVGVTHTRCQIEAAPCTARAERERD